MKKHNELILTDLICEIIESRYRTVIKNDCDFPVLEERKR